MKKEIRETIDPAMLEKRPTAKLTWIEITIAFFSGFVGWFVANGTTWLLIIFPFMFWEWLPVNEQWLLGFLLMLCIGPVIT